MTPNGPEELMGGMDAYIPDFDAAAEPLPAEEQQTEPALPWDLYHSIGEDEMNLIGMQVEQDLLNASGDHSIRVAKMARYYEMFRKVSEPTEPGEEAASTIRVPLIQWSVFQQASEEHHALFGEGARVKCDPANDETGNDIAKMTGVFMGSLLLMQMGFSKKAMELLIYRAIFGRAYASRAWKKVEESYIDDQGNQQQESYYDGPELAPLWNGDVMRPTGNHRKSIHEFEWVAVRRRYSVKALLQAEQRGEFHGVTEHLEDLYRVAGTANDAWDANELKSIREEASGVQDPERGDPRGDVIVYEYYGSRNLPLEQGYVGDQDWKRRDLMSTEIVVHWVPSLSLAVGLHDLSRLYPRQLRKRPIWETALPFGDGYERQGLGELLWELENDLTANQRQFTDTVRMTSMGFGFHEPIAGLPQDFQIEPGHSHAVMNASGVKWVNPSVNFDGFMMKDQQVLTLAERIKGKSDFGTSSSPSQPNQPRTATGQTLLVQIGNVRVAVSMKHFSDDCSELMDDLWAMWVNMGDPAMTYRVLESDMLEGQMDRSGNGHAKLTPKERAGKYHFSFSFAPNEVEKQLRKVEAAETYERMMMNPLVATNPLAMWEVTNEFCKTRNITWFAAKVPKPPDPGLPKDPDAEWIMMLNGVEVKPSMAEDFTAHLIKHDMQYLRSRKEDKERDVQAMHFLETHIIETREMQAAAQHEQEVMGALMQQLGQVQGQQMAQANQPKESKPKENPNGQS